MTNIDLDERNKELSRIEGEFKELVGQNLDGFEVTSSSIQATPFPLGRASFRAGFVQNNSSLKGTKYYLDSKVKTVHFTSIAVLLSILSHRCVRMYNLLKSNDSEEYSYASEKLALEENRVLQAKCNSFIFSMCKSEETTNEHMWENYTTSKLGVALELSIANDVDQWGSFYFSEIKYGELGEIENLREGLDKLEAKYQSNLFEIGLDHIFALHKSNDDRWVKEKELRILGIWPYMGRERHRMVFQDFVADIDGNGHRITEYLQVPLWVNADFLNRVNGNDPNLTNAVNENNEIPLLKLERILFRDDFILQNEWNEFKRNLAHFILRRLGYRVEIEKLEQKSHG